MLLRLITAISLLLFALLLMGGQQIDQALYRSVLVFLMLFAAIYVSIFFINIIRETGHNEPSSSAAAAENESGGKNSEVKTRKKV